MWGGLGEAGGGEGEEGNADVGDMAQAFGATEQRGTCGNHIVDIITCLPTSVSSASGIEAYSPFVFWRRSKADLCVCVAWPFTASMAS